MPLTNGTNSSFKLRKIDTASSTAPPSRSHSTSPIQGTTVTDYCESPDTLLPQSVTGAGGGNRSSPRTRRRDTSPTTSNNVTTTVIGMSSQQQSVPVPPVRRSSTRSEIPFIGGGFSSSSNSSSSRPLLTKRASHSSNGIGGLWSWLSGGRVRASSRKNRWSRLIGLLATLILVCWLATGWRENVAPRRKLNERWWEIEESELSPEDLSALLPKPTLPTRPRPTKSPTFSPSSSSPLDFRGGGHTLSQILKLPSTLSSSSRSFRSSTYTAIVHLTSSSQLLASHLSPLISSLSGQTPLAPVSIILLCPSGMEPQPSLLESFGPKISVLVYSPTGEGSPLLTISNAIVHDDESITSDYLVYVDGHLPGGGLNKDYVKTLLHAFGTKEYGSSLLSAGGLSLSSSQDTCIYSSPRLKIDSHPFESQHSLLSQRISLPSTPFLLPTSWLLPRSYTSYPLTTTSSEEEETSRSRQISLNSPTILQGIPRLNSLPLEISLAFALWTKSGIPSFSLPIPLTRETVLGSGESDGWVCEKLKRNLQLGTTNDGKSSGASATVQLIRSGFSVSKGAGEGLRRISGDRKKGGSSSTTTFAGVSMNALERAKEMKRGSLVLLLSGKEELDVVRKLACRFATAGTPRSSASDFFKGVGGQDESLLELDLDDGDRELMIVMADWDQESQSEVNREENDSCHLEIRPLLPPSSSTTVDSTTSISLPLIDMLDSKLDPAPAVVIYLSDGSRAREFEEVLKWIGGIFGVRKGGERISRVRMEKEAVNGGEGGKGRMTVIGIETEELKRAEWIGALPIEALRHWHTPRIDVSVITNDRPVSLHRLLLSLRSAHYFNDDVSLSLNLEQTTDRLTHRLVDDFRWNHGPLQLRHRILLGGLMPAIVESWYPASNDTYGVLLEDDVEVSPLFYSWLKFTILKYRYTLSGRLASSRLFGVSLYQQKNIELRPEGRQPFDAHKLFESMSLSSTTPYLSQIPCSWGAAYFPEQWREFHSYLSLRLSEIALPISEPIVPAIRSNRWPKSWKKYFIELVYLRGYTMLYPNYPDFESLSTNHLEKGTHVKTSQVEEKKKVLFEVPLLDVDGSLVDSLPNGGQLPEWESLPVMDLWGSLASSEDLIERGWQTTRMIGSCQALPDLETPRLKYDARELLCKKGGFELENEVRLVKAIPLPKREVVTQNEERDVKVVERGSEQEGREGEQEKRRPERRDEEGSAQRRKEVNLDGENRRLVEKSEDWLVKAQEEPKEE